MSFVIFLTNSCYSVYAPTMSFIRRQSPRRKTARSAGILPRAGVFTRNLHGGGDRKEDAVDIVIE